MIEKLKLPKQRLSVEFLADQANEEDLTVPVQFYSGKQVKRFSFFEGPFMLQFSMEKGAVHLDWLNSGKAPFLDSHQDESVRNIIGKVEQASIENGKGRAILRFSKREDARAIFKDVKDKIITNISMGAQIFKLKEVTPENSKIKEFLATDWSPVEISAVSIPADDGASFLAEDGQDLNEVEVENLRATARDKEITMKEEKNDSAVSTTATAEAQETVDLEKVKREGIEQERKRVQGIRASLKLAKLDNSEALAEEFISKGFSVSEVNEKILEKLAARSEENPSRSASAIVTRDEGVTRFLGMENMLSHRMDPTNVKLEIGKEFQGLSVLDIAKECLTIQGTQFRGLSKMELLNLALRARVDERLMMTTSDFPSLLANVGVKRLRQAYDENSPSYRVWARRAPNAPDFKTMTVVQLSANPDLLQVNEGGEFHYGSLTDGKETYSMLTFGRLLSFSRQAMINDDLRGFDRALQGFGNAAARLENRTVYAILTANAALINDSITLFHATSHGGNLTTGPGTVISAASLGVGRKIMRLQKGLQSEELNVSPRYLIVPAALEQLAYQFTSSQFVPATPATINEFRSGGRTALEPVVESILDANSAIAWYLAADPGVIDTVEYCFLDGNEGVFTESRTGFEIDGMDIKARLDFAAKAIDFRGLYKNVGV